MKKKRILILFLLMGLFVLAPVVNAVYPPNTQDRDYRFTFNGPLSMEYTSFESKTDFSSMYIYVRSTGDPQRKDFKVKPQGRHNNYLGTGSPFNSGNGGTVAVGKKYEVYNNVRESAGDEARFRGERSSLGRLVFRGSWSPDYAPEKGVITIY